MRRRETNFVVSVSIAGETRVARASWQQPWQPSNVAIGNTWLVGGFNPLKNMISSVGMIIPNIWRNKNIPNHQPAIHDQHFFDGNTMKYLYKNAWPIITWYYMILHDITWCSMLHQHFLCFLIAMSLYQLCDRTTKQWSSMEGRSSNMAMDIW